MEDDALHPSQHHLTLLGWRNISAAAPLAARPRRTGINPERKWLQTARAAAEAAWAFRINSVMVRWCGSVALHPSQRHLTLLGWRDVSAAAPLAARPRRTGINPERKWLQTARAAAGAAGGVPD